MRKPTLSNFHHRLLLLAAHWADQFDCGIRKHLLRPKDWALIAGEVYSFDLVHPAHPRPGQPKLHATLTFTLSEIHRPDFTTTILDHRMRNALSSLLDSYHHHLTAPTIQKPMPRTGPSTIPLSRRRAA